MCGAFDDDCGNPLLCGECDPRWGVCGALVPNVCAWLGFLDGGITQPSLQCANWGAQCGLLPRADGGLALCGTCEAGTSCRGGGLAYRCGSPRPPPDGGCVPRTCAQTGADCGPLDDGCGGVIPCGGCPTGWYCGAYIPNVCGH